MRWNDWKMIRLKDYGYVLYNLEKDLGETGDLKDKYPDVFQKMKTALENWETGLKEPDWHEGDKWRGVTWDIHKALMENKTPKRRQPRN